MGRNLNQSSMMLAMMAAQTLAVNAWGLPSFSPVCEIPRESNPILDGLNAKAAERQAAADAKTIEKARLKRERKAKNKLKK